MYSEQVLQDYRLWINCYNAYIQPDKRVTVEQVERALSRFLGKGKTFPAVDELAEEIREHEHKNKGT
jgi:hypothetical protein